MSRDQFELSLMVKILLYLSLRIPSPPHPKKKRRTWQSPQGGFIIIIFLWFSIPDELGLTFNAPLYIQLANLRALWDDPMNHQIVAYQFLCRDVMEIFCLDTLLNDCSLFFIFFVKITYHGESFPSKTLLFLSFQTIRHPMKLQEAPFLKKFVPLPRGPNSTLPWKIWRTLPGPMNYDIPRDTAGIRLDTIWEGDEFYTQKGEYWKWYDMMRCLFLSIRAS